MSKTKPDALLGLSLNETKLILLASFIAGDPKVDYEKLAQLGGWTPGSAAVMYRNAKRKLSEYDPANNGTSTLDGTPVTPKKSPSKRKTAAAGSVPNTPKGDGVDGLVGDETPSKQKRQRKTPVKETTVKGLSDDEGKSLFGVPPVKAEEELFRGVKPEMDDEA